MPVKIDQSGRRSVETEVEVPGTPEEVWKAIATGPGISSWFVPTTVEERVGGATSADFGFGPDAVARASVTVWNPPQRFVAESRDDMGPGSPTVATEWIVEARAGGTCLVRVVHSWASDSDKWDDQFEQHSYGWKAFFRILHAYLSHFAGQPSALVQFLTSVSGEKEAAWQRLTGPLGLAKAAVGGRVTSPAGAPPLAGVVEDIGKPPHPELLLVRTDRPAPGLAHFFAMAMGGPVMLITRLYIFGPEAKAMAAEQERIWKAWIAQHLAPDPGATAAPPA